MGKLIARRLGLSIFILLAVSVIIFCATLLLPGDPARAILGQQATPERIAALESQLETVQLTIGELREIEKYASAELERDRGAAD